MTDYRYFTKDELGCHCNKCSQDEENHMDELFMKQIIALREKMGFGFVVNSAYRCPDHPLEAMKDKPGAHTTGKAMDIAVSHRRAYLLLAEAMRMNFIGVGIKQKGGHRFIHLDLWREGPRPAIWSY